MLLERDGGVCARCEVAAGPRLDPDGLIREVGWEADHIIPLHRGGPNAMENLQTLCVPCHREKSADEARERARIRREASGVMTLDVRTG